MNNPFEILKMIKNPKEYVMNYAKNNSNPIVNNLIQMAEKNDQKGLETFAKNIMAQQGKDFDKEMKELQSYFDK